MGREFGERKQPSGEAVIFVLVRNVNSGLEVLVEERIKEGVSFQEMIWQRCRRLASILPVTDSFCQMRER